MAAVLSVVEFMRRQERVADEKLHQLMAREAHVPQRWEYYREGGAARASVLTGAQKLQALRDCLNALDAYFPRSQQQREFHDAFIQACLPQIYGSDLDKYLIKILHALRIDRLQCEVMICTARRMGKTLAVVLFVAAWLLTQPHGDVCVYSIAGRTSNMFSAQVFNAIVQLLGGDERITTYNKETLVVVNDYGSSSVLHAYPSNSKIRTLPARSPACRV